MFALLPIFYLICIGSAYKLGSKIEDYAINAAYNWSIKWAIFIAFLYISAVYLNNAFVFAMKDLSRAVGKLSDKQKEKVFGNGKRWMNLEVIYPASANVIDYDKSEIVFHGTLEYDDSGRAIGQPKDSARMLAGMIKQINQNLNLE